MTDSTAKDRPERTMRALVQTGFGGPEVLRLDRVPRPAPVPTEILVRVRAAGVNPVDWKTREGLGAAASLASPPLVPGWDVAGTVEEVGTGVTLYKPGDAVLGMPWFPRTAGACAEYVTAPARQFAPIPKGLDFEEAAALPLASLTAWQALVDTARLRRGERVLIHAAAGGVGHLAVQLAHHIGAHVIATASAPRHEWLRTLGADEVVDYRGERFEEHVSGVDTVLDLVGAKDDTSARSLAVLRPGGLLITVPSSGGGDIKERAAAAGVRYTGILVEPDGAALRKITALVEEGALRVHVDAVLPLAKATEAYARGEKGGVRGKQVLRISEN
ncbi:NADP-dependent oxidoreductase [Streptomyces sp. P6-2-1]|uniref:NADP-dependent oxidoreductase n=1 Tax=unclassified Streptomyces TaxID=2593676 RepID=UPI003D364C3A